MNLVIVESPAKGKTIEKYLGKDYKVLASFGHVRDLPKSKIGVDVKNNFEPDYTIPTKAKKVIKTLKAEMAKADALYLATDYDREGEAIAWHLVEALKTKKPIKRITFHEITKDAIQESIKHPRNIDLNLVDAQQARRVLDRLVGYKLSPFLWRKVAQGLSAGRVQSVALRLISEREREILAFNPDEYWTIEAMLNPKGKEKETFRAVLIEKDGKKIEKLEIANEKLSKEIHDDLTNAEYIVKDIKQTPKNRYPAPPFTTSTLQQDAARKLGFSAKQTMKVAQDLYEQGDITYMRTDSVQVSKIALDAAQKVITQKYGAKYALETPRFYKTKSKGAQEAHEAIRPTDLAKDPERVAISGNHARLYKLIWQRMLASQMAEAKTLESSVKIGAKNYLFNAGGSQITFDGFLKVYKIDDEETGEKLPKLTVDEKLDLNKLEKNQHFTEPPARYSDATLVKTLEEYGIGRPSTYAPTISTIIERGYVERVENARLKPTEIGILVNDLLVEHFPRIVDYQFTAEMEDDLDAVAEGKKEWVPIIKDFFTPFKENLDKKYQEVDKKEITETTTDEKCDKCGAPMIVKLGRYGKFLACGAFPKCRNIKSLQDPNAATGVTCPKCGEGEIVARRTKRGRTFFSCNRYPKCDFALWNKPTGEKCPKCQSLLAEKGKKIGCSNKECDFKKE